MLMEKLTMDEFKHGVLSLLHNLNGQILWSESNKLCESEYVKNKTYRICLNVFRKNKCNDLTTFQYAYVQTQSTLFVAVSYCDYSSVNLLKIIIKMYKINKFDIMEYNYINNYHQ